MSNPRVFFSFLALALIIFLGMALLLPLSSKREIVLLSAGIGAVVGIVAVLVQQKKQHASTMQSLTK